MLIISHEMTELTLKDRDGVTPLELGAEPTPRGAQEHLEAAVAHPLPRLIV